jgi:hypothetical protein
MIHPHTLKFHRAARIYFVNVAFQYILLLGGSGPFPQIGWTEGLIIGGSFIVFGLVFTYFIFQESRFLTILLVGVFGVQVAVSVLHLDQLNPSDQWLALFHLITFYFLSRAAFDF